MSRAVSVFLNFFILLFTHCSLADTPKHVLIVPSPWTDPTWVSDLVRGFGGVTSVDVVKYDSSEWVYKGLGDGTWFAHLPYVLLRFLVPLDVYWGNSIVKDHLALYFDQVQAQQNVKQTEYDLIVADTAHGWSAALEGDARGIPSVLYCPRTQSKYFPFLVMMMRWYDYDDFVWVPLPFRAPIVLVLPRWLQQPVLRVLNIWFFHSFKAWDWFTQWVVWSRWRTHAELVFARGRPIVVNKEFVGSPILMPWALDPFDENSGETEALLAKKIWLYAESDKDSELDKSYELLSRLFKSAKEFADRSKEENIQSNQGASVYWRHGWDTALVLMCGASLFSYVGHVIFTAIMTFDIWSKVVLKFFGFNITVARKRKGSKMV